MSYYDNSSQWPAAGQNSWEHQTPPTRSGASSAIPREEPAAFVHQIEEVDRAMDNLLKSGKMFGGMPGARRESLPYHGPGKARQPHPADPRMGPGAGSRPHSVADYGDQRGGQHNQSNLQNFYAAQRHQTSRGSNEAEQMMQAKRRMAAQRERELRNYHQEQQYNRTVLAELTTFPGAAKPDARALSPGSMSEDERRELIARQRSALYGEGPYIDETGTPRGQVPPNGPASLRGHSPLAYEYGRTPPVNMEGGQGPQPPSAEINQSGSQGVEPARTNSTASPQSNTPAASQQSVQQTSTSSSAAASPPLAGKTGQGAPAVAPIGTRPSASGPSGKRTSPPLQGYGASDNDSGAAGSSNPNSAAAEGGLSGGWGGRSGNVWGSKSGLGVQASVWG